MNFEVGTDTYMSVTEADSIITDEFGNNSEEYKFWGQLDEKGRQRVILKGTRITEKLLYRGIRSEAHQIMAWPRIINSVFKECPYDVKAGILKQGIRTLINESKQELKLQELNVKSYSVKGASITFGDNSLQGRVNNSIYSDIYSEYFEKYTY